MVKRSTDPKRKPKRHFARQFPGDVCAHNLSLQRLFAVCSDVKHHRFANSTTSGNSRTSSKNLASKGEPLSLRQTRAKGNRKFKSATGINTTPAGHRQRVALLTNATPNPHETRLRIVASFPPNGVGPAFCIFSLGLPAHW